MNEALEIASVGLVAQQRALNAIANNISNLNTPAFKRDDVRFYDLIARTSAGADPLSPPDLVPSTAGVRAQPVLMLNEQGQIESTGRELDLAIDGPGFLELMGPNGQTLLSRGGSLHIQDNGLLGSGNGLALKAAISIPAGASDLKIAVDGAVSARLAGEEGRVELGRITLVQPENESGLERLDGGLYRVTDSVRLRDASPGEDGAGTLLQGAIERSNVEINDEMIRLMIVQRAYAANAQMAQAADQLAAIANGLRR